MPYNALNADQRDGTSLNGKPSLTIEEAAAQLTRGGYSWAPQLGQGATVTYAFRASAPGEMPADTGGFSQFSASQIAATEAALAVWAGLANIKFVRVAAGGYSNDATILFGNYASGQEGASAFAFTPGDSSTASPSGDVWMNSAASMDFYRNGAGALTLMHEIGHALGLLHPSDYDAEPGRDLRYAQDASYAQDSLEYSIMSYFGIEETGGAWAPGYPYTGQYPGGPLIDDIAAIQRLYGANLSTRTESNTYGDLDYYNDPSAANVPPYLISTSQIGIWGTIWDAGGIDTINLSRGGANQLLDLRPGSFSNVGTGTGNLSIALGTIIENGIGGAYDDVLIGNDAANLLNGGAGRDRLTGGGGADVFRSTTVHFNGDTITDFTAEDRIVFVPTSSGAFSASLSGTTLTYTGGSLTIANAAGGRLELEGYADGSYAVRLVAGGSGPVQPHRTASDINGDGFSDVLLRDTFGTLDFILGGAGGRLTHISGLGAYVSQDWSVIGLGDFNGDQRADILWRNADGRISDWLARPNMEWTRNDAAALVAVGNEWTVASVGDVNGDGRDDLIWRSNTGGFSDWLARADGGFAVNDAAAYTQVETRWHVVGSGDFNGDGREDIVWRHDDGMLSNWLARADGGFFVNDANAATRVSTDWNVVGVGDFNGDGYADLLWRNDTGAFSDWLGQSGGRYRVNDANAFTQVDSSWSVADIGDYNGDGRDDVLWRNASGAISDWLGTAGGGFVVNDALAYQSLATRLQVQTLESHFV